MGNKGTDRDGLVMKTRGIAIFGIRILAYATAAAIRMSLPDIIQRYQGEHCWGALRLSHVGKYGLYRTSKRLLSMQRISVRRTCQRSLLP